jgi:hypothetical protein
LTTLPHPFIDMRRPIQGERLMLDSFLPGVREALADPMAPPMSTEQVRALVEKTPWSLLEAQAKGLADPLALAALVARTYPEAKRFLFSQRRTKERVEAMPMLQAVLMYEVYNYDRIFDDMLKWFNLPYWEAVPGMKQVEQRLKENRANSTPGTMLATLLLPAVLKVKDAQGRLERRLAALRCIEAIRLHAAAHDGKLPAALADIREVPLPVDPFTGKPFEYQADGDQATLIGVTPAGEQPYTGNTLRFELTLKRK